MTDPQPPTSPAEGLDVTAIQVRLRELATAVTQGREAVSREFTMRIPAEPLRDADLVLITAADLLAAYAQRGEEMERLTAERDEALVTAASREVLREVVEEELLARRDAIFRRVDEELTHAITERDALTAERDTLAQENERLRQRVEALEPAASAWAMRQLRAPIGQCHPEVDQHYILTGSKTCLCGAKELP